MKHLALTTFAYLASTLPGMAGSLHFGPLGDNYVAALAIIMVFGSPIFILALIFYFNYKNKQAKYRLASEALEAGKDIPNELFNSNAKDDHDNTLKKGIKNIFLGIGLGVFLWILTEEGGLAAIGFLIFCTGLGQVVTAYAIRPKKTNINTDIEKQ